MKIIERILTGISALLIALLVFGADFVSQQAASGAATVVTLFAGLLHKHNKQDEEDPSESPSSVDQTLVPHAYAAAGAIEAHGDPLGRWWRR